MAPPRTPRTLTAFQIPEHHSREVDDSQAGARPPRLRDRQADLTRRAILDASLALFREHGYAHTSVRALAQRAGVAVPTLYAAFGSKGGILLSLVALIDEQARTDEIAQRIREAEDPVEAIELTARLQRQARERAGDVIRVLRDGAASDLDMAEAFATGWARHRHGVEQMCRRFAALAALRPDLTVEEAAATALAITSLEAWEEAIDRMGWSYDQYERWLREALTHALLGSPAR